MLINKSNYEAFALDYLEGNLSEIEVREMELFLAGQPVIAAELEAMRELVTVTPDESILFEPKELLLKEETAAVVWMHPRFRQRLATGVAAMLLLTAGYFIGFDEGTKTGTTVAERPTTEHKNTAPTTIEDETIHIAQEVNTSTDSEEETGHSEKTNVTKTKTEKTNKTKETTPTSYESVAPIAPATYAENEIEPATQKETTQEEHPIFEKEPIATPAIVRIEPLEGLAAKQILDVESAIIQTETVYLNDIAVTITDKQRKREKLRGLIGRLPFEDVSIANFVPTYYSNSGVGE